MKFREILYAPWRIKYIKGKKSTRCTFCDIYTKRAADIKNNVVYRGSHSFILLNRYPYNSGHLLVVPKRHIDDYSELKLAELEEIFLILQDSIKALKSIMSPTGFNIGLNQSSAAGAGISEHLHFHIVPRWVGDSNFMSSVANCKVVSQDLIQFSSELRKYFSKIKEQG
ncbi:MAG: HIT family protein [Nitrospinota bacterium]